MESEGSTGAELDSEKTGVDPRGSGICEAYSLGRGRVGYTRVCESKCRCKSESRGRCSLLRGNDEDLAVDQALDGIP